MVIVKYCVADTSKIGNEIQAKIKGEITQEEIESFFQIFAFLGNIVPAETAYRIAEKNCNEFLAFMTKQNLSTLFKNGINEDILVTESNRLIFNLCASIITFVDYSKKGLSDRKSQKEEFESFLNRVFDSSLAYRFFYKLRNYCVHYAFPYASVEVKEPFLVDIYCRKSLLMDFSGWGSLVKKDLESMPEIIDIIALIEPLLGTIMGIDLALNYYFSDNYIHAFKSISNLCTKYGVTKPIFLLYDENENMSLRPIPIRKILEGIDKLKMHPRISINFI